MKMRIIRVKSALSNLQTKWLFAVLLGVACAVPVMAAPIQLPAIVEPASQEHHVGKLIFV